MAKSTRKYTESFKDLNLEDDFENFGYEVQNQKRYSTRNKRQTKFKDYDDHVDWDWITLGAAMPLFYSLSIVYYLVSGGMTPSQFQKWHTEASRWVWWLYCWWVNHRHHDEILLQLQGFLLCTELQESSPYGGGIWSCLWWLLHWLLLWWWLVCG